MSLCQMMSDGFFDRLYTWLVPILKLWATRLKRFAKLQSFTSTACPRKVNSSKTFLRMFLTQLRRKVRVCVVLNGKPVTELLSVTHRVTCNPTQVNAPRLNPSHAGRYSIYLPRRMEGWVDNGVGCIPRWFTCSQTCSHPSSNHSEPAGSRTCDLAIVSPTS